LAEYGVINIARSLGGEKGQNKWEELKAEWEISKKTTKRE